MKMSETLGVLLICGFLSLIANVVGTKNGFVEAIPGMLFLIALAFVGIWLGKVIPGGIPGVAYVVTIGCILTVPGVPCAAALSAAVSKVGCMQLCTPILAYAGISLGKDLDTFKKQGAAIVAISLFAFLGTFIGSAVIAQLILKLTGVI